MPAQHGPARYPRGSELSFGSVRVAGAATSYYCQEYGMNGQSCFVIK